MKIEEVKRSDNVSEFSYKASKDVVEDNLYDAVMLFKNHPVPGFRKKSKAPFEALRARYKKDIDNIVKSNLLSVAIEDISTEHKLEPLIIDVSSAKLSGRDFTCSLSIVKKPEFELAPVTGWKIPSPHIDYDPEAKKESIIQELRVNHGDSIPYDEGDFVCEGHKLVVDFSITIDGEVVDDRQGFVYDVGPNSVKGFNDSILGMVPGDTREFTLDVDGKQVTYKVVLHSGIKVEPHELNDEFAKIFGFDSLIKLEESVLARANNEFNNLKRNKLSEHVSERLLLDNEFEVPDEHVVNVAKALAAKNGLTWEAAEPIHETIKETAEKIARLEIIVDKISKVEPESNLSNLEAEKVAEEMIMSKAMESGISEESVRGILAGFKDSPNYKDHIKSARLAYVFNWILSKSEIVE